MRPINADSLIDTLFKEMKDIINEGEFGLEFIIGIGTAIETTREQPTIDYTKYMCKECTCENWDLELDEPPCFLKMFKGGKNETD